MTSPTSAHISPLQPHNSHHCMGSSPTTTTTTTTNNIFKFITHPHPKVYIDRAGKHHTELPVRWQLAHSEVKAKALEMALEAKIYDRNLYAGTKPSSQLQFPVLTLPLADETKYSWVHQPNKTRDYSCRPTVVRTKVPQVANTKSYAADNRTNKKHRLMHNYRAPNIEIVMELSHPHSTKLMVLKPKWKRAGNRHGKFTKSIYCAHIREIGPSVPKSPRVNNQLKDRDGSSSLTFDSSIISGDGYVASRVDSDSSAAVSVPFVISPQYIQRLCTERKVDGYLSTTTVSSNSSSLASSQQPAAMVEQGTETAEGRIIVAFSRNQEPPKQILLNVDSSTSSSHTSSSQAAKNGI